MVRIRVPSGGVWAASVGLFGLRPGAPCQYLGVPIFWRTIPSPSSRQLRAKKSEGLTKKLEGRENLGFHPNVHPRPQSTPNNWLGNWWLQSKRALYVHRPNRKTPPTLPGLPRPYNNELPLPPTNSVPLRDLADRQTDKQKESPHVCSPESSARRRRSS
jgi:hypothetical protein